MIKSLVGNFFPLGNFNFLLKFLNQINGVLGFLTEWRFIFKILRSIKHEMRGYKIKTKSEWRGSAISHINNI